MNSLELISQQRQKESRFLKVFLASSLMGSLVLHASSMTMRVGNFWNNLPTATEEDEIEVMVIENSPERPLQETLPTEEPPLQPEIPQEVALVPDPTIALTPKATRPVEEPSSKPDVPKEVALVPDPTIALAPETPLPTGVDAPLPKTDPVIPTTNSAGNRPVPGASGPIADPQGTGSGFGNTTQPTGFASGGRNDGRPEGTLGGNPRGNGDQTVIRTVPSGSPPVRTAVPQPARSQPPQPVCVSCPNPTFQGVEASPRVDLRILPDGSVEVMLRQSSGNAEVDRATLEAMSQWRFDPQTVPQEGVSRRVRVTYEEEGSNFQRENENRRRLEAERQAAEQRRREETITTIQQPASTATETPDTPAAIASPPPSPASSAPATAPLPAPVEVLPLLPAPAPVPPPPEAPVSSPPNS